MSNTHFTFAPLDFTFNRPNYVRESNKAGIHLFHGRASQRYGSIPSVTSRTKKIYIAKVLSKL